MKTKLLLFSSMAFVMLCFNGCTPEEVQTTQDQFKPLIIRLTLANPIASGWPAVNNYLMLNSTFCALGLMNTVSNQVGQSVVECNTTAVSNTNLILPIQYVHSVNYEQSFQCNTVLCEIIYNGQIVFSESRDMGSFNGPCGDGDSWVVNYTLP
jgi:hypothetical protein